MIVKITFADGLTMMFGTSYKKWTTQFDEYCWHETDSFTSIKSVEVSNAKWIGWGGLKWCPEDRFQHQLNREGCQDGEPDNPNPRLYSDMSFYNNKVYERMARRILRESQQERGFNVG